MKLDNFIGMMTGHQIKHPPKDYVKDETFRTKVSTFAKK
mgnify:CR=1 FL=1